MAREIGIPRTILKILNKMKYHLYHVTFTQALNQEYAIVYMILSLGTTDNQS